MSSSEGAGPRAPYDKSRLASDLAVYAVTDSSWLGGRPLEDAVAAAVRGGAGFVQLREKGASHDERCALAERVLAACRAGGVPLVIDDDVACALEVGADGAHVGQRDEEARQARRELGPGAILGVSAQTVWQAERAVEDGADYLGVAVFPTGTKPEAGAAGLEGLARVCAAVEVPVVAIGGMRAGNAALAKAAGAAGVAVVSAIFAADDPEAAARELRAAWEGRG